MIYFKKLVTNELFKTLSITSYYFYLYIWQHTDTVSKKRYDFWADLQIDSILGFFGKTEL